MRVYQGQKFGKFGGIFAETVDQGHFCWDDGEVDRSPTGTGVSARVAIHHLLGQLPIGESITIESILGTCMNAEVVEAASFGGFDAVIPQVTGRAWIIGRSELYIDPSDPLRDGFLFR